MGVELEYVAVLLQRRFNVMQEMKRLTSELKEAASRNDKVSLTLILQMRADEMAKAEACQEEIWLMAERGPEEAKEVRRLMSHDFIEGGPPEAAMEQKIYEIRRKTASVLNDIREADQYLNRNVGGKRSYYSTNRIQGKEGC